MAERNYRESGSGRPGFMATVPPVTKWLLIVNVAVYLLDVFAFNHRLRIFGAFAVESAIFNGRVWEFFTFQFLHGHVTHILFNSLGLYFFGPWMERWWGPKKFLAFYLLSGAGGALFYTVLALLGVLETSYMVGASAGIYGILIGIAVVAPHSRVQLLFPPVELSMRQMALLMLGFAVIAIATGFGGNAGGEAGHLGGAIVGFLLVKFPVLLSWIGNRDPDVSIIRPKAFARRSEAKLRPRVNVSQDTEIDLILDKVSRDGFQSLTDEERAKLQAAANSNTTKR